MGVLEFFGTLLRNNITLSAINSNYTKKTDIEYFLVDFNSIIHVSGQFVISELNSILSYFLKNYDNELKKIIHNQYMKDEIYEKSKYFKVDDYFRLIVEDPKVTKEDIIKHTKKYFVDKKMDKIVIREVALNFFKLLKAYLNKDVLKGILIAIDGVPSKSKMVEQRQRRYMGSVINEFKNKIFKKYSKELKNESGKNLNNYYDIQKNSIKWNRNLITPGTDFMDKLSRVLKSDKIQSKIKKYFTRIEDYIVSDMYEVGEGEKKIINYINKNNISKKDKYLIYSPDADMILLALILGTDNVDILRHNQQTSAYDYININTLRDNISYYITKTINESPKIKETGKYKQIDNNQILNDLVCLSTLFGNDFLPKMETLSVKHNFKLLIDAYIESFLKNGKFLCMKNKTKYELNLHFLRDIFNILNKEEIEYIEHNEMYQKYHNYSKIKDAFSYVNVVESNIHDLIKNFFQRYTHLKIALKNNQNLNEFVTNKDFMSTLRKLLVFDSNNNDKQNVTVDHMNDNEYMDFLKKYVDRVGAIPKININPAPNSKKITDGYHKKMTANMNKYEKEIYSLEKMLDEYAIKFNAKPLDLRFTKLSDYYYKYFKVKNYEHFKDQLPKELLNVVLVYFEGLYWVFDYYFNNDEYINYWYYAYERAPLMRDMIKLLNYMDKYKTEINNIITGISKYNVPNNKVDKYFNTIEQLIYVSPMTEETIETLPEEYRAFIRQQKINGDLTEYFIDIEKIVQKLWNTNINDIAIINEYGDIDCQSVAYLNKCFLKPLEKMPKEFDDKFISLIRKNVKVSDKIKKRTINKNPKF
jgi:5'-3' exonuclease